MLHMSLLVMNRLNKTKSAMFFLSFSVFFFFFLLPQDLTIVMVFNAILGFLLKAVTNWFVKSLNRNF